MQSIKISIFGKSLKTGITENKEFEVMSMGEARKLGATLFEDFKIIKVDKKSTHQNFGVLSCDINNLTDAEIKEIVSADWFEPKEKNNKGIILIDTNQLKNEVADVTCLSTFDLGISQPEENIKIDDCLKRWNDKDGFYHA